MANPDSIVGLKQATIPDAYIDNEDVNNNAIPGGKAKRQRVATPDATALLTALQTLLTDFSNMDPHRLTLTASTDTPVTFATTVRMFRVKNFDTANSILVKTSAITGATDAACDLVGPAPTSGVPNEDYFPLSVGTIHVFSSGASVVVVTGFS